MESARDGVRAGEGCTVTTRVLVVDDHAAMRRSVALALDGESGMQVVGEAANGDAAVRLAEQLQPDVVIMDVGMPSLNGIDATRRILEHHPQMIVIALSVHDCAAYAVRMLQAGARAYVLKDGGAEELVSAMRAVCLGGTYVSSGIEGLRQCGNS